MEPMTLGSPVSSPSTQNPGSPFLPGFLIGDPAPQPTSPSKTPRQVHFAPNLSTSILTGPQTPSALVSPGPPSLNDSLSRFHKNQREKSGGPPTVGLFDTLDVSTSVVSTPPSAPFSQTNQSFQSQVPIHSGTATPNQSAQSLEEAERWVTVFGFPAAAATSVIGQFSQVGHIVEHRFPGQGNWVNIYFQTKLDARRALSYNGKILGGHTMIGVVPCRDYIQHGSALKDMTNMLSGTGTPSTPKSPQLTRVSSRRLVTSPASSPYLTSPRAGRALGISSPTETEVVPPQNTPTKNSGFMSRAVDYVFGF